MQTQFTVCSLQDSGDIHLYNLTEESDPFLKPIIQYCLLNGKIHILFSSGFMGHNLEYIGITYSYI